MPQHHVTGRDAAGGGGDDEEKKRYFKIEAGRTAPSSAAWSAENVKKRKAEKQLAVREQKRQEKTKGLIKRSGALAHPQTGGRLVREFGVVDPELPVAGWAAGLRERGSICFLPGQEWREDARDISCMLINGEDEASGLGAAYATPDGHHVIGSYIPTDKDEKINFAETDKMRASRLSDLRAEAIHLHEITSMSYHKPSHSVVVTSINPTGPNGSAQSQVSIFQPRLSEDLVDDDDASRRYYREEYGGRKPAWLIGGCDNHLRFTSPVRGLTINSARTCPTSPPGQLNAVLATSHGLIHLEGAGGPVNIHWVTPAPGDNGTHGWRGGGGAGGAGGKKEKPVPRDVFSVDYHPSSNGQVLYAGCRDSRIHRVDMRAPHWTTAAASSSGWDFFRHHSAVAHVRCLDDNQILAAGPKSSMAIYDVRWISSSSSSSSSSPSSFSGNKGNKGGNRDAAAAAAAAVKPVVQFPGYRNAAHMQIGLDVTHDVGGVGGLGCGGVVAAGMDDGTVGVFSLRSGRRLRAGDVDDPGRLRAASGGVVKALQFERMPWERGTSLFVGVGPVVKKFSFGVDDDDEEGEW
ncbi:hypothetical protein VMCG_04315 [Cytospora schulzeri]|uniref:Myocyte-specific enhancer factor 2d n=1 Tax=Cytospora schulzeri TaxID=448051 RepID=A0A423WSQ2_9PEZI|nr:hypothetical protein VMCG_04315 [Valsa malicola]